MHFFRQIFIDLLNRVYVKAYKKIIWFAKSFKGVGLKEIYRDINEMLKKSVPRYPEIWIPLLKLNILLAP